MHESEAGIVRRIMNDPRLRMIFTTHARQRMGERDIAEADVRHVLRRCKVTEVRPDIQGPVWNAEATDLDGRRLRICVSVKEANVMVIVITAIDL
jgi:hypothetical protein